MERGIVREWHDDLGWGVIDSPGTPGGCWTHFSHLQMSGLKRLEPGDEVVFDAEAARQDGFEWRATLVLPDEAAYASSLTIELDGDPSPVRVFRGTDLSPADPTPGMERSLAFELPMLWAGRVVTAPGSVSGWHHHDRNDSSLYIVSGTFRFEFEGRAEPLDAGPGDFVHVPAWTVHRESNPTDGPSTAVIARVGGGIPTVNVDAAPPPHA
jgi:quercetin dioxygenase-like cupin family protein/cold shock CspA family protein